MRIVLFITGLSIFLSSCGNKTVVEIPSSVLSQEKLVRVMVDMQLMEAALSLGVVNANIKTMNDTLAMYNVFQKDSITKTQYDESMKFYSQHPEILNKIYDDVIIELTKKQAKDRNPSDTLPK